MGFVERVPTEQAHGAALVDAAPDAVIGLDPDGTVVSWNPAAERLLGAPAAATVGARLQDVLVPDDPLPTTLTAPTASTALTAATAPTACAPDEDTHGAATTRRLAQGDPALLGERREVPVRRADGSVLRVEATLVRAGRGLALFLRDVSARRALEDVLRYQNSLLEAQGEASVDGIAVISPEGRIISCNRRFQEIWHLPDDVVARGDDATALDLARRWTVDPEGFIDRVAFLYDHPEEHARDEVRLVDGRVLDRHGVPLLNPDGVATGRVWFFRDVTEDRRREEQQRYLVQAGVVLGAGLDQDATLERIAQLAVPELADWCMVYLAEDEGAIRRVAIAHRDHPAHPAAVEAAKLSTHPDIDPDAEAGVPLVIRTARPFLQEQTSPELMAADATDPDGQAATLRELSLRSWICVPLIAGGVTMGALSLVTAESGRVYGETDLRFAEQIALRAALALDNARLYTRQSATAEQLQRSLLPERLPVVAGTQLAARYVPGTTGVEVGGDWYDAVTRGPSELAVAIGDVAGRGVRAASVMGQLRTALRAYVLEAHPPEEALTRLDGFIESNGTFEMATALCLAFDVRTGALRLASAGHPPPLVVLADGTATFLQLTAEPPLGTGGVRYHGHDAALPSGATVLLYTDGLVERRGESLLDGLDRLAAAATGMADDPEELVDRVLAALVDDRERPDDVALIALRVVPEGEGVHLRLPARPAAVPAARHAVAGLLEALGMDAGAAHDVGLATSEAVADAVERAMGPQAAEIVLDARRRGDDVEVRVRDFGRGRTRRDDVARRGAGTMRAVMDSVEVDHRPTGTIVTLRRRLRT